MDARYLTPVADLLVFHKVITQPSDLSRPAFTDKIMEFQEKESLLVDGVVGPETLWALQFTWAKQTEPLLFVRCEADVVSGIEGYGNFVLREDAAKLYVGLRNEVKELGGVITSAGAKRSLSDGANANRSAKSMHYTGLALDLATSSGFFDPQEDPYVITKGEGSYWNVWCRADGGDEEKLKATYWDSWGSGKDRTKTVQGKFLNFTALCRKHGFHPIPPRRGFTRNNNRKYLSSEWWHFQATDLLVPELSQFGIELLRIDDYTETSIPAESESIWGNRKATFRVDWF